jgi:hypothetical protein
MRGGCGRLFLPGVSRRPPASTRASRFEQVEGRVGTCPITGQDPVLCRPGTDVTVNCVIRGDLHCHRYRGEQGGGEEASQTQ